MARKKAKKKVVTRHHHRGMDQNSFLIILGGGLLVILFVTFSMGMFGVNRISTSAQKYMRSAEAASKETVITIQNSTFSSPVTVKAGTKVTWMNNDTMDHTVVADDGSFDLGVVTTSQSKSYTFTTPGTYAYHCNLHPGMSGTVIVE